MIILGIDCASISCSVAVSKGEEQFGKIVNNGLTHSQTLAPMIEEVLNQAQIKTKDIDLIAVTKGPGSFTGLRIGMSTVKGIAAVQSTPCVCISTLEAIGFTASEKHDGILCAVMDARCSQVYNAIFRMKDGKFERLCEDRALSIEELEQELLNLNEPITLCGDGTKVCETAMDKLEFAIADESVRLPHANAICTLAKTYENEAQSPEKISPAYLRLPQASRELLKKKKEN